MDQRVQCIHTQQTGCHNRIIDNGLEYDGCRADRIRRNQHRQQFRCADTHRIARQLGIREFHTDCHVPDSSQKRQDQETQ